MSRPPPTLAHKAAAFVREHPLGMLLFAVGTGVLGNFVYDGLKRDKQPVADNE